MKEGVDGLLRDKTRPSRIPPLARTMVERVVALTAADPPRRSDALDRGGDGQGSRDQRQFGAAHLARAWPAAAPGAPVQAVQRPAVRRQAARHRRPLRRSAGPCRRALGRREEPDPGARPHPTGPADEEGPRWHHDARLQAPRHHHAVRRARRAGGQGHRPAACSATAIRSSFASSTPSRPRCRPAR